MGQCTVWEIVISALCWRQMATEEGMEGRTGAQQEQMGQAQVERWLLRWLLGRSMNRRKLILQKVEWPGTTIAKIFAYRSPNSSYMARTWGKKQINTAVWEELDFTNSICEPWYNDTGQTTLRASPLATPFWWALEISPNLVTWEAHDSLGTWFGRIWKILTPKGSRMSCNCMACAQSTVRLSLWWTAFLFPHHLCLSQAKQKRDWPLKLPWCMGLKSPSIQKVSSNQSLTWSWTLKWKMSCWEKTSRSTSPSRTTAPTLTLSRPISLATSPSTPGSLRRNSRRRPLMWHWSLFLVSYLGCGEAILCRTCDLAGNVLIPPENILSNFKFCTRAQELGEPTSREASPFVFMSHAYKWTLEFSKPRVQ